ncbi:hypothetical protein AAVH_17265 [Aphelenchoides avenae]|nr:hypothetical protein AAVH_17265 [Aphelenchus avenae]
MQNTTLIDAELCRERDCGVRHIFPVDVVFVAHKEGPLHWWNDHFAPGVEGVHYPDRRDIDESEKTVQKRHLSELIRHHASDMMLGPGAPEIGWNAIRFKMAKESHTYPKPKELKRFKSLIAERLKPACELAHDKVKIYGRVFAHLMFDRVYFEAVKESGVEDFDDSFPLPLIPAGLRRNARAQWIADFAALVAYAEDHSETAYRRSDPFKHGNETTKTNVRKASPVFVGRRSKATDANKRLADENARMAAKLERMKTTLKVLMSKVAAKTQQSADGSDKDFVEHLRSTISALLQRLSNTHDNPGSVNASAPEDSTPELAMLTEQLEKLEQSNERLQNELVELRKQLADARLQKKTAEKGKN